MAVKVADGFVDIHGNVNEASVRRAARRVADEFEREVNRRNPFRGIFDDRNLRDIRVRMQGVWAGIGAVAAATFASAFAATTAQKLVTALPAAAPRIASSFTKSFIEDLEKNLAPRITRSNVMTSVKETFDRAGTETSTSFFKALFTPNRALLLALRTGIPAILASPIGASALILGGLWAVSFVSAILSSGALLTIGAAFAALGIFALRENEKIRQAFSATGKFLSELFAMVASPMIQPIINALEIVRMVAKERIAPEFAKIIHGTGHLITTLAAMVTGAIAEFLKPLARPAALEGLRTFILNVQPHVLRLGRVVGEFFAMLMRHGPLIANAFGVVVSTIETFGKILAGVLVLGSGILLAFADLWNRSWGLAKSAIDRVTKGLTLLNPELQLLGKILGLSDEKLIKAKGSVQELPPELQDLLAKIQGVSTGLTGLNSTATQTTLKFDEVTQKAQSLFSKFMSVDQATANATATIMGLKDALDVNGRSLDVNTLSGARNRTAILNAVQAAEQQRQKMIESGDSTAYANKVFQENIDKIRAMANAFGVDQGALERFLDKYYRLANAPNISKSIKIEGYFIGDDQVYQALGSNLKFYAHGGKIAAKQAAIVGENGPELFVPNKAGMILSHQKWMQNTQLLNKWMRSPGIANPSDSFPMVSGLPRREQDASTGRTVVQNFYITTQEIDPRVHAAQLGWEIVGRS